MKLAKIIKENIVDGLGIQVIMTSHNEKTFSYLAYKKDVCCFIMNKSGQIKKYTEREASKLLSDAITIIPNKGISVYAFERLIMMSLKVTDSTDRPRILMSSECGIESLIKLHTYQITSGCLRFLEHITKQSSLNENDVSFIEVEHLYKGIDLYEKIQSFQCSNYKVAVVWQTGRANKCFDCIILFKFPKFLAIFCQITVIDDEQFKVNQCFAKKKFSEYTEIINKMKNVEFILIHSKSSRSLPIIDANNDKNFMYSYPLQELGSENIFDSEPLRKIMELRNIKPNCKEELTKRTEIKDIPERPE